MTSQTEIHDRLNSLRGNRPGRWKYGISSRYIKKKAGSRKENKPIFELRIGIHTRNVVAGIVGLNKFAYDIWGDTVNLASRMESSIEAGKINISGAAYQLVKNHFSCNHRGKVLAKNKDEVDMYFVERMDEA